MSISTVLLAYKEEENLRVLLPIIKQQLDGIGEEYEIIIIDSKTPLDNTETACKEYGAKYVNQRYSNFGGAFVTGIEEAKYDVFLILDADGSHNPEYISDLYKKYIQGYDIVIGSRYVKGGVTNDSRISTAMSLILNSVFRIALGIKAKDISTDYRMYNTEQLKRVKLNCENFDVLQEVLMKMKINNPELKIGEVPITFNKRLYGDSKRDLLQFIISYLKTLINLTKMRMENE